MQVWVLDALPGAAQETVQAEQQQRQDHPADLIPALRAMQLPLPSRAALQQQLLAAGFSCKVAAWIASSLRPTNGDARYLARPWLACSADFEHTPTVAFAASLLAV